MPQISPNPGTITNASLNSPKGWMDYPLGTDVIAGDPQCRAKVLRTVGTVTPYKVVSFFTAQPSCLYWRFDNDETLVMLEGHTTVTFGSGERVEMRARDAISVLGGRKGVCEVFAPSRKFTVLTSGT